MTPHNTAEKGAIAKTVLMPGDPLRAKFIAENFLENAVQYNNIRGMLGFTGEYKGVKVSVQGSGMGMPSMGIYSYELFNFYDVENIIRIGTAATMHPDLHIKDLALAMGACTNSAYINQFNLAGTYAPIASYELLSKAVTFADKLGVRYKVGNVFTSDVFYVDDVNNTKCWQKMGVLCVEMETAALYANAAKAGKNALSILTMSDSLITGEETTPEERQKSFTDMMEVALNVASAK